MTFDHSKLGQKEFFERMGGSYVNGALTVEYLYQRFKERLLDELRVRQPISDWRSKDVPLVDSSAHSASEVQK